MLIWFGSDFILNFKMRWVDYIVLALENLDGRAPYKDIYNEVEKLRVRDKQTLPRTWKDNVRGRIEVTIIQ